ncbi:putative myc-type, basic helix-loop-helix (bHLH) domain-containing protein [Acrodontium crateriforme]|uniref:Myc-type, basic helix-loop-helix (BHLH) domain-containing protein n=1 Tax=Acrodontium crateriforme TaxID=150365 RepID=A0AAQ3MA97_9PEZI|nr:putative myc-type, basic helix-loop-helix (bHLH) domain-containing protein [Acrodontium crateriforme]
MSAMANKRKRDAQDMPNMRAAPPMTSEGHDFSQPYGMDGDESEAFAALVAHHNAESADVHLDHQQQDQSTDHNNNAQSASDTAAAAMAQFHTMTVPQSTEEAFMRDSNDNVGSERPPGQQMDQDDPTIPHRNSSFGDFDGKDTQGGANGDMSSTDPSNPNDTKPTVGSEAWHKVRRDNHKEVERRRRETINEGITELSKIVPGCEKNKGSILARAVQFITQLKENETQNIEKWTLEKMLTEQAIAELSSSCDKLKAECQRAWTECESWKKAAQKAGVSIDSSNDLGEV